MNRFFTKQPLVPQQVVTLEQEIAAHVRVLRLKPGDSFELVDEASTLYLATIQATDLLQVLVTPLPQPQVELPVQVHLVCGVPKGDKADWIVQKATELGATHVSFFNSRWATAKWQAARLEKKLTRLKTIALNAAEQSHRLRVPTIDFVTLAETAEISAAARLIAYEEAAKAGERAVLARAMRAKPATVIGVFGPEGGLHPEEVAQLEEAGFQRAGLGPRILRTETAPLYFLAAISTLTELQGEY